MIVSENLTEEQIDKIVDSGQAQQIMQEVCVCVCVCVYIPA